MRTCFLKLNMPSPWALITDVDPRVYAKIYSEGGVTRTQDFAENVSLFQFLCYYYFGRKENNNN